MRSETPRIQAPPLSLDQPTRACGCATPTPACSYATSRGACSRDQQGVADIARYSEKTEADLAWDDIRVTVQYLANLHAARAKARALNRILPKLQDQFEQSLSAGPMLALGPGHIDQIKEILTEELGGLD